MVKILQHGPAFVQQPTERNLMRSYRELSMPTMAELFTDADDAYFYVYFQTKTTPCRQFYVKDNSTGLLVESKNSH